MKRKSDTQFNDNRMIRRHKPWVVCPQEIVQLIDTMVQEIAFTEHKRKMKQVVHQINWFNPSFVSHDIRLWEVHDEMRESWVDLNTHSPYRLRNVYRYLSFSERRWRMFDRVTGAGIEHVNNHDWLIIVSRMLTPENVEQRHQPQSRVYEIADREVGRILFDIDDDDQNIDDEPPTSPFSSSSPFY